MIRWSAGVSHCLIAAGRLLAQLTLREVHAGDLARTACEGNQGVLVAHVAQVDARPGLAVEQFAQLRDRKSMARMETDPFVLLRQDLVDLDLELLRKILQLRTQPRPQSLARPHQFVAERGEPRAAPLFPLDQGSAEERGPFLDQIPAMPIRHVGALRGAGDLARGADLVQEVEHHEHRLVVAMEAPHGLDLDADLSRLDILGARHGARVRSLGVVYE